MKRVLTALVIAAAACIGAANAETLTARQGNDSVTLYEKPCTNPDIVKRLNDGVVQDFQAASAVFQGQSYQACWIPSGNVVYLIYEDGDQGMIPVQELRPALVL